MAFLVADVDDFMVASTDDFLVTSLVDETTAAVYMADGAVAVMTPAARATFAFIGAERFFLFDYQPTTTPPVVGGIDGVNLAAVPSSGIRVGAVAVVKARAGATVIWE